jgi:cysteinyl-tRNA synthetase
LIGGGDDADVNAPFAQTTKPAHAAFLQQLEQLRLHRDVDITDFIQEQTSTVSRLDQAQLAFACIGEGTAFKAKQLGFEQIGRISRNGASSIA